MMKGSVRPLLSRALRNGSSASIVEIVVSTALALLVFRIIVDRTSLAVFGIWTLTQSLTSLVRLADVGVSGPLSKYIGEIDDRTGAGRIWQYVDTALLFNTLFFGVLSVLAYLPLSWSLSSSLPISQARLAIEILPITLVNLVLSSISGVPAAALIGVRRGTAKSVINMLASVVLLLASLMLVGRYGLYGLAFAQMAQQLFAATVGWVTLSAAIHGRTISLRLPTAFSMLVIRNTVSLSLSMQVNTIISQLYEVVLKLALTTHGGASAVALYEITDRFIRIARQVILMPMLLSVPVLSRAFSKRRFRTIGRIYERQLLLTTLAAIVVFTGALAITPLASAFVLSGLDARFFQFLAIVWSASLINVLAIPAYMLGLGSGRLGANYAGNVYILATTVVLANLLGSKFGAVGALAGGCSALATGGLLTMWASSRMFHVSTRLPIRDLAGLIRRGKVKRLLAPLFA